jgi:hypothetical protein
MAAQSRTGSTLRIEDSKGFAYQTALNESVYDADEEQKLGRMEAAVEV